MCEAEDDLERRTLAAFDELDDQDKSRMLLVLAAMRAGIEIDPADMHGKTSEELRLFADHLWERIASQGREH